MQVPIDAVELLDREYLMIRAKILELAATFDRIDRSRGDVTRSPEMIAVQQALEVLLAKEADTDRAERIQRIFSRPYAKEWKKEFEMPSG